MSEDGSKSGIRPDFRVSLQVAMATFSVTALPPQSHCIASASVPFPFLISQKPILLHILSLTIPILVKARRGKGELPGAGRAAEIPPQALSLVPGALKLVPVSSLKGGSGMRGSAPANLFRAGACPMQHQQVETDWLHLLHRSSINVRVSAGMLDDFRPHF